MSSISMDWKTACGIAATIAAMDNEGIKYKEITICSDGSVALSHCEDYGNGDDE